jgi:hypothetical protein
VGQLLWPEKVTQADLDGLKITLGSYRHAGQYQQRPSPEGGGMLKKHWWGLLAAAGSPSAAGRGEDARRNDRATRGGQAQPLSNFAICRASALG